MSGLFLMLFVAPIAATAAVVVWAAWWLTADFLSTPRATRINTPAPWPQRQSATQVVAGQRLAVQTVRKNRLAG
jgi:hypothetical protein